MPEGHTIHRLAQDYAAFTGGPVRVTSPQGKFSDAAALLDGAELTRTEAHGKHLFLGFRDQDWVHIHLGLFGKVAFGPAPAPPPTDTVRLRLADARAYVDLRGPTTCALITPGESGRDTTASAPTRCARTPTRTPPGPGSPAAVRRSRRCSMDQKVVAGVGNVYRAEVLFRHGIDLTARAGTSPAPSGTPSGGTWSP
ncbi:DNA-(apurinic or apyrimidinic site) lyase OS=Streptomyces fumanus OX=67302 GN=nei PE=3 SV=1 [Streptomyces fumanus]